MHMVTAGVSFVVLARAEDAAAHADVVAAHLDL
jgi:hypothetical protein